MLFGLCSLFAPEPFKWNGKDKNKNTVPKGTYKLVITAKYDGQSYQITKPITIN